MKYDPRKAFPYPVLPDDPNYNDDYVQSTFQPRLTLAPDTNGEDVVLTAEFDINEEAILDCIGESAAYAVHVLCAKTNYRHLIHTDKSNLTWVFKNRELHDKVVLTCCVVCTDEIKGYRSPNFHPEFGGAAFDMPQGAVMAIAAPEVFFVDADPSRPLGTVFQLLKDNRVKPGEFDFDCESDLINVRMRDEDFTRFNAGRGKPHIRRFLIMSVYFPILIEILRIMRSDGEMHEGKKWYRAIQSKLDALEIELDDGHAYQHAQRLLRSPLRRLPLMEE